MSDILSPTLQNILDQPTLRWIFVGGKGGVGKTTTSCSLALAVAQHKHANNENILIISTDPAHNLSDAFNQKFSKTPTLVNGTPNLYAMEIDPHIDVEQSDIMDSTTQSMLTELASSIPGIDEAMAFASIMSYVQTQQYSTVLFDTAPTGHTLRLLSFPSLIENAFAKLEQFKDKFGMLLSSAQSMTGTQINTESLMDKLTKSQQTIKLVNTQFKDSALTTFVCVCIPEFLSLYETERLVQELTKYEIDTHCIVVNQVLMVTADEVGKCRKCTARQRMQKKYIDQIGVLYDDFHVVMMPQLNDEVRGVKDLSTFSDLLIQGVNDEKLRKLLGDGC